MQQRPEWSGTSHGKVWGRVFWAEETEDAKSWEGNKLGIAKEQKEPTEPNAEPGLGGGGRGLGRGDGSGLIYLGTSRSTEGLEAGY